MNAAFSPHFSRRHLSIQQAKAWLHFLFDGITPTSMTEQQF
ncbi:hypothetical protein QWZ16_09550 [Vibrio ostreicida]|uniref:Uncharacterized protein n=1 Tax=Vibrio ostreicida TaxID=526588 RepID=A0ABT8BTE3_9VIBR|nr:hypothetical protein [Vibrio ostreicida]MDN3609943.1 hypothetical protein [Vibrio ostreicida]